MLWCEMLMKAVDASSKLESWPRPGLFVSATKLLIMKKAFDLILFGATGFVGRQAIAYLSQRAQANTRWAIAGRSQGKLQAALDSVAQQHPKAKDIPIIVADAQDEKALNHLAASTRVVLSCAGPYALYGSKLVAACIARQTHYADITGETPWVRQMIDLHHETAQANGTRIVPGCGFDSVPSDLGAYLVQREMTRRYQQECTHIKAAFSLSGGGLNGGTAASMMNMIESGQLKTIDDPFLLNPPGTAPSDASSQRDPLAAYWDKDFNGWLGLFVMGPINTRVVRRSMALRSSQARYQEYMRFGRSPVAGMVAGSFGIGSKITTNLMKQSRAKAHSPTRPRAQ
jgi:short subunit dehydrogenase-like uncharacterized protein